MFVDYASFFFEKSVYTVIQYRVLAFYVTIYQICVMPANRLHWLPLNNIYFDFDFVVVAKAWKSFVHVVEMSRRSHFQCCKFGIGIDMKKSTSSLLFVSL